MIARPVASTTDPVGETPIMTDARFLVTGASGFIAMHLIELLLSRGHRVRGTLRQMDREPELREALSRRTPVDDRLELVRAELNSDDGWRDAAWMFRNPEGVGSAPCFPLFAKNKAKSITYACIVIPRENLALCSVMEPDTGIPSWSRRMLSPSWAYW